MTEIETYLEINELQYDALIFTEHWLRTDEFKSIYIEGYTNATCYSRSQLSHGGSCIFVKKEYSFVELDILKQKSQELDCECTAVQVEELGMIILSVYRSPSGDIDNFINIMESILDFLVSKQKYQIFICGDFNINLLDLNPRTIKFTDLINNFNLSFTITEPTRENSLIDNIIINKKVNLLHAANISNSLSDHRAQNIIVECGIQRKTKQGV